MTGTTAARIAKRFVGLSLEQRQQFLARLRQEGIEADVRALFEQPTLAGYAAITENMEIIL
ncbi:hypothetical protein F2S75_08180 [Pseudomonas syringae pv. actinidiae]|nr:hypothetical protein [Pseudomonas syringae pv. actinidiae]